MLNLVLPTKTALEYFPLSGGVLLPQNRETFTDMQSNSFNKLLRAYVCEFKLFIRFEHCGTTLVDVFVYLKANRPRAVLNVSTKAAQNILQHSQQFGVISPSCADSSLSLPRKTSKVVAKCYPVIKELK